MPDTAPVVPSVVIVGSGAAGLAAALAASGAGAAVTLVERAPSIGGTTAMSGGVVWMPGHGRHEEASREDRKQASDREAGKEDSIDDVLTYVAGAGGGEVDLELVRAFAADTGRVADAIEDRTPIEWEVLEHWPDYRGELPGAASGRSMWPRALRLPRRLERQVQSAFDQPSPTDGAGSAEASGPPAHDGVVLRGHVRGRALVGGLLSGLLDMGVEVRTSARASALEIVDDGVVGVVVDGELVAGRVVLATGGFQHDAALVRRYLPGPAVAPLGPGGCRGDGLEMVMAVDSVMANASGGLVDAGHAGAR